MSNQITIDDIQKAIDRMEAALLTPPPERIFYVIQPWIDAAPEYFYQDEFGDWWFETPWTEKMKAIIIPQRFNCKEGYLIDKKAIDTSIWRAFNEL